jgi:phosphorylated adapter RNA export protein
MPNETVHNPDKALIKHIAETLQEVNLLLIKKVVDVIGPERAKEFLQKTLEVEAAGGLMLPDSSRRRTPGGVFFYTVRRNIPQEEQQRIWSHTKKKKQQEGTTDSTSAIRESSTESD